jgi:ADP-ribosylglycohydrolase
MRKAVSLGGDSDTLACITGGVAEAFYGGVPAAMAERVMRPWPKVFKDILEVMRRKTEYGKRCVLTPDAQ